MSFKVGQCRNMVKRQLLVLNLWLVVLPIISTLSKSTLHHQLAARKIARDNINPGFISIDCGVTEDYIDINNGIWYQSDSDFVETGKNYALSPDQNIDNPYVGRQLSTLRSFPEGKRNCYTLKPKQGKNSSYLIRAFFAYGNYDNIDQHPTFDLFVGVYYWDTITIQQFETNQYFYTEINYAPSTDTITVCLVNSGQGVPYISSLELRPLNNSIYQTFPISLPQYLQGRYGIGIISEFPHTRFKDDVYDRIWNTFGIGNTIPINGTVDVHTQNRNDAYNLPAQVLTTAVQPLNGSNALNFYYSYEPPHQYYYYVYLHFFEFEKLQRGQKRVINITIDKYTLSVPITLQYLKALTISSNHTTKGYANFSISSAAESDLPPILNALEIYRITPQSNSPTDTGDVNAILDIKQIYEISRIDWQGDPCAPLNLAWTGLICSSGNTPRIISVKGASYFTVLFLTMFYDEVERDRSELASSNAPVFELVEADSDPIEKHTPPLKSTRNNFPLSFDGEDNISIHNFLHLQGTEQGAINEDLSRDITKVVLQEVASENTKWNKYEVDDPAHEATDETFNIDVVVAAMVADIPESSYADEGLAANTAKKGIVTEPAPSIPSTVSGQDALVQMYQWSPQQYVIVRNLSSSNLAGEIVTSFFNLTRLEHLDLSNNELTGLLPEFLAELPNLKILDLSGNKLTGPVPTALKEKLKNKTLDLSVDGNPGLCLRGSCKKRKFVIPLVSSIAVVVIIAFGSCIIWRHKRKRQGVMITESQKDEGSLRIKARAYSYSEILNITDNFKTVIGEGGFGKVYLGTLHDDTQVAIKLLSLSSRQGYKAFQSEVELLMFLHHRNLVCLMGYCDQGDVKALIYEYMDNGNLQQKLSEKNPNVLKWIERLCIAVDVAQGLDYLHNGCRPPIIHRDLKTSNILLNAGMQAKIADFGLSRAFANDNDSRVVTFPAGTPGYLDPQFQISKKSDIYSFGVILFELITGQRAIKQTSEGVIHMRHWVIPEIEKGDIQNIIDKRLEANFNISSAQKAIDVATSCISMSAVQRPDISHILAQLKECLALEMESARGMSSLQFESQITDIYPR